MEINPGPDVGTRVQQAEMATLGAAVKDDLQCHDVVGIEITGRMLADQPE